MKKFLKLMPYLVRLSNKLGVLAEISPKDLPLECGICCLSLKRPKTCSVPICGVSRMAVGGWPREGGEGPRPFRESTPHT